RAQQIPDISEPAPDISEPPRRTKRNRCRVLRACAETLPPQTHCRKPHRLRLRLIAPALQAQCPVFRTYEEALDRPRLSFSDRCCAPSAPSSTEFLDNRSAGNERLPTSARSWLANVGRREDATPTSNRA